MPGRLFLASCHLRAPTEVTISRMIREMSLADVDEIYVEQRRIAAEMQELLHFAHRRALTQSDPATLAAG
jgi:hypothetical protein